MQFPRPGNNPTVGQTRETLNHQSLAEKSQWSHPNLFGQNWQKKESTSAIYATKEVRLRTLQWKIIHNIYPTQILLHKMGIAENSNCKYCHQRDYLEHFFVECSSVAGLWREVNSMVARILNVPVGDLTVQQKLFGVVLPEYPKACVNKVNLVLLVAKMCISKYKYGQYSNLILLFNGELLLRKIADTTTN